MTQTIIPPRSRTSSINPNKISGLPTFTSSIHALSSGIFPSSGVIPGCPSRSEPEEKPAHAWLGSFGTTTSLEGSSKSGAASWLGHGGGSSVVAVGSGEAEQGATEETSSSRAGATGLPENGSWDRVRGAGRAESLASPAESSLSASDYLGHGGSAFGTQRWLESATTSAEPSSPTRSIRLDQSKAVSNTSGPSNLSQHVTDFPLFAHHHPVFSTTASPTNSVAAMDSCGAEELSRRYSHKRSDLFFSDPGPEEDDGNRGLLAEPFLPTSISELVPLQIGVGHNAVPSSREAQGSFPSSPNQPFSPASAFLSAFSETHSVGDLDEDIPPQGASTSRGPHGELRALSEMSIEASEGDLQSRLPSAAGSRTHRRPSAPDAAGSVVLGYTLGKVLGRGGFSTVRLATHNTTGEKFACRIIKRDDLSDISGSVENFEKELELWQALPRHPNVLPLLEMYRDPRGCATYLISPYMTGGSLLDVLKRDKGSERVARKWFPGIVAAVKALHEGYEGFEEGGMLHGDLKLDNFLVGSNGEVCVCDFGLARKIGKVKDGTGTPIIEDERRGRWSRTTSRAPTPHTSTSRSRTRPAFHSPYQSASSTMPATFQIPTVHSVAMKRPESRDSHPTGIHHHMPHSRRHGHGQHDGQLTPINAFPSASLPYAPPELLRAPPAASSLAQDMWAVGIILHALLTSRLPFVDTFDPRLQMKIIRGDWAMPDGLGREWQECLVGLLDGDKETRWDISRLAESDAVIGWSEVKPRSKSRSRSRSRRPGLADRQRSSSRTRAEDVHHPSHDSHRFASHLPHLLPPKARGTSFNDLVGMDHLDKVPEDGERFEFHRDLSASGTSRSRSSGRGEGAGMFPLEGLECGFASVPGPRSPSQKSSVGGRSRSRSRT